MQEMLPSSSLSLTVALATVTLAASLCAMAWRSTAQHSRHSALSMLGALLAMLWMGAAYAADMLSIGAIGSDIGLILCLCAVAGILAVSGIIDRVRPAAFLLCGVAAAFIIMDMALPVFDRMGMLAMPGAPLYAVILIAATSQLLMAASLPLHPARFTRRGAYRYTMAGWADLPLGALMAAALLAIGWRIQAFAGVNSVYHLYAGIIASTASAFAALAVAHARHMPHRAGVLAAALPAGALIVAALPYAEVGHVITIALITGAATALTRDALVALRIDEPSGIVTSMLAPAVVAWIAIGCLIPASLAAKLQWLGVMLACGLILGCVLSLLARTLTGLRASSRLMAEGLDVRIAAP